MKTLKKTNNLDKLISNDLVLLTEKEASEINGGILGLLGLIVGSTALSYQLFKFGWDAGVQAAK